jgi:hypothetical protein
MQLDVGLNTILFGIVFLGSNLAFVNGFLQSVNLSLDDFLGVVQHIDFVVIGNHFTFLLPFDVLVMCPVIKENTTEVVFSY